MENTGACASKLLVEADLSKFGAEPLDGSGFESEEPEPENEKTNVEPEVAQ